MSKTATITAKLEPELQEAFAQLAKDAERSVSDLACEVLTNHVTKFSPVERGGLVTIPIQVGAREYAELRLLDRYTTTKVQDMCLSAIQFKLNVNKPLLGKIRRFTSVTPDAETAENPRFRFVQWTRDSRK